MQRYDGGRVLREFGQRYSNDQTFRRFRRYNDVDQLFISRHVASSVADRFENLFEPILRTPMSTANFTFVSKSVGRRSIAAELHSINGATAFRYGTKIRLDRRILINIRRRLRNCIL